MLKKKMTALLAVLLIAIAFVSVNYVYAAESTNLKLEYEPLQMMEMPAGATVHMEVELSLKKGYCIEPVFSVTPDNNAPFSFSNIKVRNKDLYNQTVIYMDENTRVVLEFDMKGGEVMVVKFFVQKDNDGNEINSWYYETWKKVKMPNAYPKDLVR